MCKNPTKYSRLIKSLMMLVLLVLCGGTHEATAFTRDIFSKNTVPISKLPKHIKKHVGSFGLFADYTKSNKGYISIYLINDSSTSISIPTQDGNTFLKQEILMPNGEWMRVQSHRSSWCGNSYYNGRLRAHSFLVFKQKRLDVPKSSGTRLYKTRFRMFNRLDVKTNVGTGHLQPVIAQKLAAKFLYDHLGIQFGSFRTYRRILLFPRKTNLPGGKLKKIRNTTLSRLYRFPENQAVPLLKRALLAPWLTLPMFRSAMFSWKKLQPAARRNYLRVLSKKKKGRNYQFLKKIPHLFAASS